VPIRTLDSVLEEAGAPKGFDFLSIDVEGHEIEVLRVRYCPLAAASHPAGGSRRGFVEDRFLNRAGYRIVRRYENNGWYVPHDSPVQCRWSDRWEILRKYYLALPFRLLRNLLRRLRANQG